MNSVMITTGDELLTGEVADKNLQIAAQLLYEQGIQLTGYQLAGDDVASIEAAIKRVWGEAQLIIISGGLGSSRDDVTREAVAQALGLALEPHAEASRHIAQRLALRGLHPAQPALLPAGAQLLLAQSGATPGLLLHARGSHILCLPGTPEHFRDLLEENLNVLLKLIERNDTIYRERIQFFGIDRRELELLLARVEGPSDEVRCRETYPELYAALRSESAHGLERLVGEVTRRAGRWEVGRGGEWLAQRLGRRLKERGESVTTAESCTSGAIARALTEPAGAGTWFQRGWVTYANEAKIQMLGVSADSIERHGAVSREVVCQMASGARERAQTDWALAVSGLVSPGGESAHKPVGTVHFGIAGVDGVWHHEELFAGRSPDEVQAGTVYEALSLLLRKLEDKLAPGELSFMGAPQR